MNMDIRLSGIELLNFKSIGDEYVSLIPWKRCNILIGQNNSGKSNVIDAIEQLLKSFANNSRNKRQPLSQNDTHRRTGQYPFKFRLHFNCPSEHELAKDFRTECYWMEFSWEVNGDSPKITDLSIADLEIIKQNARRYVDQIVPNHFGRRWNSQPSIQAIRDLLIEGGDGFFNRYFSKVMPKVNVIPEFRKIQSGDAYAYDGTELIGLLASFQHPEEGHDSDRDKFDEIEEFTRQLLHMNDAKLEVTHDKKMIMLTNDGLRLPLEEYGTGVHELIIMTTAILAMDNSLCCIEEPEIHLHPRLQREFVEFIAKQTTNQFLLSTHSPTFINAKAHMPPEIRKGVQVFHIFRNNEGATAGNAVLEEENVLVALNDLGVHASDLIQANSVIWVEGPSDRIYINHWLRLLKPELIEGLHYSIMFYGGGLRSHLSFLRSAGITDDSILEELIEVLKINQNAVVVMDSDRGEKKAHINKTKQRVCKECETSGGIAWVTSGREIENYLPPRVINRALEEITGAQVNYNIDRYEKIDQAIEKALSQQKSKNIVYSRDKSGFAREFVKHFLITDMSPDLRKILESIIGRIEEWNS